MAEQQNQEKQNKEQSNVVYVGKKPTMNYVLAVVTLFNNGQSEVVIKARGKAISKAADVKEIVRNKFMADVKEKGVKIYSEDMTNEDGSKSKISAIEIVLSK
ncbi:MAG: DNA/RNA-binding protein Alba 2 [Candidatus Micrarchaeota archaeon]|nr:MAG: DNA/RNA-binding protein Alba 2 [Candidatus Micrarchaeota archaeon]